MSAPTQQYPPAPHTRQAASIATASVVLGAIGFVIGVCSIIGLVLGLVARGQARRGQISPARVKAGIVVSAVSLGLGIVGWIVVLALIGGTAATTPITNAASEPSITVEEPAVVEVAPSETTAAETAPEAIVSSPAAAPETTQADAPAEEVAGATVSQENAVRTAERYLEFSAFSRSGLITQLEFEGFSTEDATYGVDNTSVDYNEQAAKAAANYLDFSSFSRQGLIDQLVFEGYTQAEAEFGVSQTGL